MVRRWADDNLPQRKSPALLLDCEAIASSEVRNDAEGARTESQPSIVAIGIFIRQNKPGFGLVCKGGIFEA